MRATGRNESGGRAGVRRAGVGRVGVCGAVGRRVSGSQALECRVGGHR